MTGRLLNATGGLAVFIVLFVGLVIGQNDTSPGQNNTAPGQNDTTPSQNDAAPSLTAADYPSLSTIYHLRFYTLDPDVAALKTRNCSEAYYKYYMQERFYYMTNNLVTTVVPQKCAPGTICKMTQLLYFSQYTEGDIYFNLQLSNKGTATISDIADCLSTLDDYITQLHNWCPDGYFDSTSFFNSNFPYTRGCDILHVRPETFVAEYMGWGCRTPIPGTGPSTGCTIMYSCSTLASLFIAQLVLAFLR